MKKSITPRILAAVAFTAFVSVSTAQAQMADGIRIDGGDQPVIVCMDRKQISLPSTSCFIANLRPGNYLIEVYTPRPPRRGQAAEKGERIFHDRIRFDGRGVKEIPVGHRLPDRPHANRPSRYRVMDDRMFKSFYQTVKDESFDSKMIKAIETALVTTHFTSEQCARLTGLFSFDSSKVKVMKLMYPQIVDKEAFFTVVSTLDFSSSKEQMNQFIKEYHRK